MLMSPQILITVKLVTVYFRYMYALVSANRPKSTALSHINEVILKVKPQFVVLSASIHATTIYKCKEGNSRSSSVYQISLVRNRDKAWNKCYTQDNTTLGKTRVCE